MKPSTRFLKMYYKLPPKARKELVYHYYDNPMSLNVIAPEVRFDTELGKKILLDLGYEEQ